MAHTLTHTCVLLSNTNSMTQPTVQQVVTWINWQSRRDYTDYSSLIQLWPPLEAWNIAARIIDGGKRHQRSTASRSEAQCG